jgi:hypothetical protein
MSLQIVVDLTPASSPWNQQPLPDLVRGIVEERREERPGIGPMTKNSAIQQALLKPEFAHLYPGVASNEWQPAGLMLEQVNATFRRRTASPKARAALDTAHFCVARHAEREREARRPRAQAHRKALAHGTIVSIILPIRDPEGTFYRLRSGTVSATVSPGNTGHFEAGMRFAG